MDEAFVQNAEDKVDDQDGGKEKNSESGQRRFVLLRRSLEAVADVAGENLARHAIDLAHGIAQRNSRLEVERKGDGGELAEVVDHQRAEILRQV